MKVAIITPVDNTNIGNRLQNYAVSEILKEFDLDVMTIEYFDSNDDGWRAKMISTLYFVLSKIGFFRTSFYIYRIKKSPRLAIINEFNKNYLKISSKYLFRTRDCSKMKKCSKDFDYYCIGSDQIWNPALVRNNGFFFGCFAEGNKVFSFSASMGTTYIDANYIDNYKNGLSHCGNISVREKDMQYLIKKLVNRDSTVLLDPTLLLKRERWLAISRKPNCSMPTKYIITYFLGKVTETQKQFISVYANKHNCTVVSINGVYNDYVGPSEFIYLISNADFIFTDSFHGTAFSVIFNKSFITFNRNNMYDMSSRIKTLLKTMGLSERFYTGSLEKLSQDYMNKIDNLPGYNAECTINLERHKAEMFLKHCLKED